MSKLFVSEHPLIHTKMAMLRDEQTGTKEFREIIGEVASLLLYEATRDLPLKEVQVKTPIATATCKTIDTKLAMVPILRAGLGMVDGVLALVPSARVGHIGLYRDPDTLQPVPDGTYGELVFTCIGKEALPLVRYRTRDICALNHEQCACGRTLVKMTKPKGRSDDMLIIRGVNVFPSQVEHVILELGMEPNYQIVVTRENNLDIMEVYIEMSEKLFSDSVRKIEETEARIKAAMQTTLGVSAVIHLVEPQSIPRSEGKAVRVIDKRVID